MAQAKKVEDFEHAGAWMSERTRSCLIFGIAVVTLVAFTLGIVFSQLETETEVGAQNTVFGACANYQQQSGPYNFFYEGLGCQDCEVSLGKILLKKCNHTCAEWTITPETTEVEPIVPTCEDPGLDHAGPDYHGACPEGYYRTIARTGCRVATIEDILLFKNECFFCGSANVTKEQCIEVCEENHNCVGYLANPWIQTDALQYLTKSSTFVRLPKKTAFTVKKFPLLWNVMTTM